MTENKTKTVIFWLIISLFLVPSVYGENWISASLPNSYQFTGEENSQISIVSGQSGTPTGYIILADLPYLPSLGYENYQIALSGINSEDEVALINVEFFDIALHFRQKYTSVLLGYGYGSMKFECKVSSCSNWTVEKGIARQVFAQVGVELFNEVLFQISAHRVMGNNQILVSSTPVSMDLNGLLFAYGVKIGF